MTMRVNGPNGIVVNFPDGTDAQTVDKVMREATGNAQQPAHHDWSELPGNIPSSAAETAKGLYNMVRHPIDTVGSLAQVGSGAINNVFPQLADLDKWMADKGLKTPSDPNAVAQQQEMASQTGAALKDRYGGMENIRNTIITDPVGVGLDAATLYAGGAGLAGRGPMVASKAINTVQEIQKMPRAAETLLRRAAPNASQNLSKLGDEAMLLDASPSMTGLAQGVVTKPSPHSDRIVEALTARNEGRSDRLLHGTQNTLGRLRDPVRLKTGIDKATQRAAGPFYKWAKANAPDLTGQLDDMLARELTTPASGMTQDGRRVVFKVMDDIDDALNAGDPKLAAQRLHDIRKNLDARIVYGEQAIQALSSADKAAQAPLKKARAAVDKILKEKLPGFKEGDAITATGKKAQSDVDFGYDSLEGGKTAMFPETFAKEYAKRDPKYVAEGVKSRIANALGTNANDTAALKRVVGDGNDFNRRKLVQALGQDKTDKIVQSVEREQQFGQNYADITRNSQTARRQASQKLVEGTDAPHVSQGASLVGLGYAGAAKGINALLAKGVSKYSAKNAEALAKALQLKGVDARRLAGELAKSNSQGDKLRKIARALIAGHVTETVNRPHR